MPIVKYQSFSKSSHHASVSARSQYLLRDDRAVLQETLNVGLEGWPQAMDADRRIFDKDDGRLFFEMVVSPAECDRAPPEQVLELSRELVMRHFPTAQVAIVIHCDNRERGLDGLEGIPHAHIVVNNVDLETGRKIHLDRDEIRAIHNDAQEIAESMGLSRLDDYRPGAWLEPAQERQRTLAERQIEMSGRECWKETVREMAVQAAELSLDLDDFERKLAAAEASLEIRDGRIYLVDVDHPDRACRADKLDRALSARELGARFMTPDRTDLSREAMARHLARKLRDEIKRGQEAARRRELAQGSPERERSIQQARQLDAPKTLERGARALLELAAPPPQGGKQQGHGLALEGPRKTRKHGRTSQNAINHERGLTRG